MNVNAPDAMLREIARQQVLDQPLAAIHGTAVYRVQHAWQEEALATLHGAVTVTTPERLKEALKEGALLLIPRDADISYDQLTYMLEKNTSGMAVIFFAAG